MPFFDPVRGRPPANCVPGHIADVGAAPGLQPECTLVERWPDDDGVIHEAVVPECVSEADADATCFVYLTDATGATETAADDMQDVCVEEGAMLELRIVRPPGQVARSATIGSIACLPC